MKIKMKKTPTLAVSPHFMTIGGYLITAPILLTNPQSWIVVASHICDTIRGPLRTSMAVRSTPMSTTLGTRPAKLGSSSKKRYVFSGTVIGNLLTARLCPEDGSVEPSGLGCLVPPSADPEPLVQQGNCTSIHTNQFRLVDLALHRAWRAAPPISRKELDALLLLEGRIC